MSTVRLENRGLEPVAVTTVHGEHILMPGGACEVSLAAGEDLDVHLLRAPAEEPTAPAA